MAALSNFFRRFSKKPSIVIVVSGLPRSGTSMMMKMLEAGGIPALTDEIRTADDDNPKGYFEFERAKKLPEGDTAWIPQAAGKVVKTISALLEHLPADFHYRVIFMRRSMSEILASQKKMLINRGENPDKVDDEEMAQLFEAHLEKVSAWLREQPNFETLYVNYNELIDDPEAWITAVDRFLDSQLDTAAMRRVVDPNLYRQREES